MSYFTRFASRVGAAAVGSAARSTTRAITAPAMRLQSPVVAADQRLSLPGVAEIGIGTRRVMHHSIQKDALVDAALDRAEPRPPNSALPAPSPLAATRVGELQSIQKDALVDAALDRAGPRPPNSAVPAPSPLAATRVGGPRSPATAADSPTPMVTSESAGFPSPRGEIETSRSASPRVAAGTGGPHDAVGEGATVATRMRAEQPSRSTGMLSNVSRIEPSPIQERELRYSPRPEPAPALGAADDVLGALSAALARVDAWITSDSKSADDPIETNVPNSRSTAQSVTPTVAPIDRIASAARSEPRSRLFRMASRVAGSSASHNPAPTGTQSLSETERQSSDSAVAGPNIGDSEFYGTEQSPRSIIGTAKQTRLPVVERAPDIYPRPRESVHAGSELAKAPARPMPLVVAPLTPPAPEPTLLSIGHIEVQVVLPQKPPEPATAPPPQTPASGAPRACFGFGAPRRAFGWRQN